MLISDRPINLDVEITEIKIPNCIQKELTFFATHAYAIEPTASDRKELITKQFATEFYDETSNWFKKIQNVIKKVKKDAGNVVLIETYYDQNIEDVIWICEEFPISKFDEEELSFEFDTIYTLKE